MHWTTYLIIVFKFLHLLYSYYEILYTYEHRLERKKKSI